MRDRRESENAAQSLFAQENLALTFKFTSCVKFDSFREFRLHIAQLTRAGPAAHGQVTEEMNMFGVIRKWMFAGAVVAASTHLLPASARDSAVQPTPTGTRVVVVLTNHDKYPSREDTTGVWLTELTHFYKVFDAAGIKMDFVSPRGGRVPLDERSLGWPHADAHAKELLNNPAFMGLLNTTLKPEQLDPSRYAAIFYTGGHGTMWDFRGNDGLRRVAEAIYRQGGVVASVCHGAAGLIDLKADDGRALISGRRITGFSNLEETLSGVKGQVPYLLQDELLAQGAAYEKSFIPFRSYVVTDGRLVTGQNPGSSMEVAQEVLRVIGVLEKGGRP